MLAISSQCQHFWVNRFIRLINKSAFNSRLLFCHFAELAFPIAISLSAENETLFLL